eukprot:gnl/TRDRNA2_/TRDRNA2_180831_c0_seq1.p1 gnl/TRDRNA2_/TRDRNA2_180831_c0~~gnl/TRDRNA2_/TRDRNA2_180831_c0_seq1.p1  ORF type:complete len:316 (-),score=46.50 gnl/TRDRNA2_/TRDRNA2_180831_c0_seq1:116-1063(-)
MPVLRKGLQPARWTAFLALLPLHATAVTSFLSPKNVARASSAAMSSGDDPQIEVYFGCGRFWHMQFAFAKTEKHTLQREGQAITARTAYAGGVQKGPHGMLCYHNYKRIAEYALYGHAEVVTLKIPQSSFGKFAETFWQSCPGGIRRDHVDIGPQYRALIGVPGGLQSTLAKQFTESNTGDSVGFVAGKGGEHDEKHTVFVYDTASFPGVRAEKYHQFHDDSVDGLYPKNYRDLNKYVEPGQCPGDSGYLTASKNKTDSQNVNEGDHKMQPVFAKTTPAPTEATVQTTRSGTCGLAPYQFGTALSLLLPLLLFGN